MFPVQLDGTVDLDERRLIRSALRELRRREIEDMEAALASKRFRPTRQQQQQQEQEDKENQHRWGPVLHLPGANRRRWDERQQTSALNQRFSAPSLREGRRLWKKDSRGENAGKVAAASTVFHSQKPLFYEIISTRGKLSVSSLVTGRHRELFPCLFKVFS